QGSTGPKEVWAKWAPVIYHATYYLDGGTNGANPSTYSIETGVITLLAATRTGYTFGGWYAEADFSGETITQKPEGFTGDIDLFAKWIPIIYNITYNLNGGTNDGANPADYTIGRTPITLRSPTRDYYTFIGWYDNTEFSGDVVDKITEGSISDRHFYSGWTPINYSITYTLSGGTNNEDNPDDYTVESSTINLKDPTKDEFYFAGWFEEASFTTMRTIIAAGSHTPYALYAKWNKAYSLQEIGPEGGIIFYDRTDYNYRTDDWHYLECAGFDMVGIFTWTEPSTFLPYIVNVEGTSVEIGTGRENSTLILAAAFAANNRNSAANTCDDYPEENSQVWFLPSKNALAMLDQNLHLMGVGGFTSGNYWSSSQASATEAWAWNFDNSTGQPVQIHKSNEHRVRPIRRF
ncbi:MAG: InlB B-repeat-containing protein, partial [Sphaerochaeta sp.]|nr:InlB B-repeat-containing protein [Sphaerochaeta sp.]